MIGVPSLCLSHQSVSFTNSPILFRDECHVTPWIVGWTFLSDL